jgi:hypothetical protein
MKSNKKISHEKARKVTKKTIDSTLVFLCFFVAKNKKQKNKYGLVLVSCRATAGSAPTRCLCGKKDKKGRKHYAYGPLV